MSQSLGPISGAVLRVYKLTFSPLFAAFGVQCRHSPTCSEFAAEAMTRHGAWAGGWMGLARFIRCRPGGTHGHDTVPDVLPNNARWWTPWRYGMWK